MKKRDLNNLVLNKKSISTFKEDYQKVKGGRTVNKTCEFNGTIGKHCQICHEI